MTVLVTGATGFVGREVLRELGAAGYATRVLARRPDSVEVREVAARVGAVIFKGNVLDADSLNEAMAGAEAVIHLVGIISECGEQTFENLHVQATRNVLAVAKRAGVGRFVHMSALGTRPKAVSRYHQTKWAAEELVRGSGLDWTLFRPSLIYGPGDHFVNLFARMARFSPVLPVMGSGRAKLQPVAVETVAASFAKALTEPRSVGQTFDLCGPERLTMKEILEAILAATGRKRWIVRVPLPLARVQARLLELIWPALFRSAPPLNRDQLLMLEEDNVGDAVSAVELFGLEQKPFREAVAVQLGPAR